MANLTEQDILAPVIGKSVCLDGLGFYAKRNAETEKGVEHIIYICDLMYDQKLRELFGITEKLKDIWERRGTVFNIYLYLYGGIVREGFIRKFSEGEGARPSGGSSLTCTQQELRIARRILSYITAQ